MSYKKVQCWIFSQNSAQKIFCLLLKTTPERKSFWQPVTGSVEAGEGFFEAACREPVEETGFCFTTKPTDTGFEFEYSARLKLIHERVFTLYINKMPTPVLDPIEHTEFQWLEPFDAIPLLRYDSNVEGLKTAYRTMFQQELTQTTT